VAGSALQPEIEYVRGQKSVDWIWTTPTAVILIECKSARMTAGARAGDPSLHTVVENALGKARRQIARTAELIRAEHASFSSVPSDRRIIGLTITTWWIEHFGGGPGPVDVGP